MNAHTGKYCHGRYHQIFSCQSGPFKSSWEISRIAWLGAVVSILMTASKKNISHNSLCAFKAQPASFATAQSQLWPDLYNCPDWKEKEKKKFCCFAQDFCSSFSNLQALLFKVYMSMCAFIRNEQYHRALHKPQSSGSCFFFPETQSECGWCRRAVSRMRKLLWHVISKPLWLLLKPSFPWSSLCGLFIWSQNVSFAMVILGMWMGACMFQPPSSQVHWGAMLGPASLGSWKDSQAKECLGLCHFTTLPKALKTDKIHWIKSSKFHRCPWLRGTIAVLKQQHWWNMLCIM